MVLVGSDTKKYMDTTDDNNPLWEIYDVPHTTYGTSQNNNKLDAMVNWILSQSKKFDYDTVRQMENKGPMGDEMLSLILEAEQRFQDNNKASMALLDAYRKILEITPSNEKERQIIERIKHFDFDVGYARHLIGQHNPLLNITKYLYEEDVEEGKRDPLDYSEQQLNGFTDEYEI